MIKTVVTDVDGVMTDGGFYYTESGKVMKRFAPHDSDGVKMLKSHGIDVVAISADARGFAITKRRCDDMKIPCTLVSEAGRLGYLMTNFQMDETAFVGDGIHDVPSLKSVALGFAPSDATAAAKDAANIVTETCGGRGVLLEVATHILKTL